MMEDTTVEYGADSIRQPDVPRGTVTKHGWKSQFFLMEETTRDYWIYVPAQYDPGTPIGIMVFQDGEEWYVDEEGAFRVPIVFDNLIHKKTIPPLIGLFINPGESAPGTPCYEYDSLGDTYVRFLIEEMIPEVGKKYNLTDDPKMRAILWNIVGWNLCLHSGLGKTRLFSQSNEPRW
jgi:enterochelin esterase family protein